MTIEQKNTIEYDSYEVISNKTLPDKQHIITIKAPQIVKSFKMGQFVHLQCAETLLMRRPFSIMSVDKKEGTFNIFYKEIGYGSTILSKKKAKSKINVIGPIGKPFMLTNKTIPILIGGGLGMPPIISMAQNLAFNNKYQPAVFLGSKLSLPFAPVDSNINFFKPEINKTIPIMDNWQILCRLASEYYKKGIFTGFVTDLADIYIKQLSQQQKKQIEFFACGPYPMLEVVHKLALKYNAPCQISVEEYMACGVGGCAGCAILIKKDGQLIMKRVCVIGPVFNSYNIFY